MSPTDARRKHFIKWQMDRAIHQAMAVAQKRSLKPAFHRLLAVVVSRSNLLRPDQPCGHIGWRNAEPFLRGLLALSSNYRGWLKESEEWEPPAASLLEQFGSLARHLLASHPVPNFMTKVWLAASSAQAQRHQKLFKHLGLGNSIRGADVPLPLTRAMADHFMHAPDHFSVEQALRWSQVLGLGGSERFASAVLATFLGDHFEHEAYWSKVIEFLVRQPKLDVDLIPPIVEFLHAQQVGLPSGRYDPGEEQSFGEFLKSVTEWMASNPTYGRRFRQRWASMGISGFRHVEAQEHEWSLRYWTIRELLDGRELYEEGNELRHCVACYADWCAAGTASIWSMQCHGSLSSQRVLTIQVNPQTRTIIRALGWCNRRPKPEARQVMVMWAEQTGLKVAKWI